MDHSDEDKRLAEQTRRDAVAGQIATVFVTLLGLFVLFTCLHTLGGYF